MRSLIELAHNLGFVVVAEGVEDAHTLDALGEMGCDFAQGYLMARPMPAADVPALDGRAPRRSSTPADPPPFARAPWLGARLGAWRGP